MLKAKLQELGLTLPTPPKPVAKYDPLAASGEMLYISGQLPMLDGKLMSVGKVGGAVSMESAQAAARQATLNALALIDRHIGGDWKHRFDGMAKATVYVASAPDFTEQHLVADAVSELLTQALGGRKGKHARAAVGCVSLPLDAPVEVELIARWVSDISPSD
jgi:enamine deaminase RidA (YjgF/YER057c/UK114 family)